MTDKQIYFKPSKLQVLIRWVLSIATYSTLIGLFDFILQRGLTFWGITIILYAIGMGFFAVFLYKKSAIKISHNKVVGIDGWARTTIIPLERIDKEKTRKLFRFRKILSGGEIVSIDGPKILIYPFFNEEKINEILKTIDCLK